MRNEDLPAMFDKAVSLFMTVMFDWETVVDWFFGEKAK